MSPSLNPSISVSGCQREQRNALRELKVWADQMDRDCAEAQTDAGDLSQQYQVHRYISNRKESQSQTNNIDITNPSMNRVTKQIDNVAIYFIASNTGL